MKLTVTTNAQVFEYAIPSKGLLDIRMADGRPVVTYNGVVYLAHEITNLPPKAEKEKA